MPRRSPEQFEPGFEPGIEKEKPEEKEEKRPQGMVSALEQSRRKYEGLREKEKEDLKEEIEKEAQEMAQNYITALEKLREADREGKSLKEAGLTKEEKRAFFGGATGSKSIAWEFGFEPKRKEKETEEDFKKRKEEEEKKIWEILTGPSTIIEGGVERHLDLAQELARAYFTKKRTEEILEKEGYRFF